MNSSSTVCVFPLTFFGQCSLYSKFVLCYHHSKQLQQGVHQRPLGAAPPPPPRAVPVDRGLRQQRVGLSADAAAAFDRRRCRAARHRGGDGRRESGEGHGAGPRGDAQLSLGVHRVAEPVGAGREETVEKVGLFRPGKLGKRYLLVFAGLN